MAGAGGEDDVVRMVLGGASVSEGSFWKNRIKPAQGALTTFIAAIGVFNITAQIDALKQLSATVEFLLGYWRYVRHLPFAWLHLRLSPSVQDALVLATIAFVAADVACRRQYGLGLLSAALRGARSDDPAALSRDQILSNVKASRWQTAASLLALVALLIVIGLQFPWFLVYVVASSFGFVFIITRKSFPPDYVMFSLLALFFPAMALVVVSIVVGVFWRAVLYTAGWVVGLIALNWLLVHVLDPLAPIIATIPAAPPVP